MNNAIARRILLERIYDKMSDEEKRIFVMHSMMDRSDEEILRALQQQSAQMQDLRRHQQTFAEDFASNIAGNFVYGGVIWLASKLFGK